MVRILTYVNSEKMVCGRRGLTNIHILVRGGGAGSVSSRPGAPGGSMGDSGRIRTGPSRRFVHLARSTPARRSKALTVRPRTAPGSSTWPSESGKRWPSAGTDRPSKALVHSGRVAPCAPGAFQEGCGTQSRPRERRIRAGDYLVCRAVWRTYRSHTEATPQ